MQYYFGDSILYSLDISNSINKAVEVLKLLQARCRSYHPTSHNMESATPWKAQVILFPAQQMSGSPGWVLTHAKQSRDLPVPSLC